MKKLLLITLVALSFVSFYADASAGGGVTDAASLFKQAGSQSSQAVDGWVQAAGFIGVILFTFAGVKLFNSRDNQQESKGKLWMSLGAGVFLIGLWTWLAVVSNTATGTTQSADNLKAIVKGSGN